MPLIRPKLDIGQASMICTPETPKSLRGLAKRGEVQGSASCWGCLRDRELHLHWLSCLVGFMYACIAHTVAA